MQPKLIELDFIAAASAEALARYPFLDHPRTLNELTVISDSGDFYHGAKAWLLCLWALREYREWAFRFSTPALMPLARRFVVRVSSLRFRLGANGS